jgi:hypothetical protein
MAAVDHLDVEVADVASGAESTAGAAQDDDANIVRACLNRLGRRVQHRAVEGIETLWIIPCDGKDIVRDVKDDRQAHVGTPGKQLSSKGVPAGEARKMILAGWR